MFSKVAQLLANSFKFKAKTCQLLPIVGQFLNNSYKFSRNSFLTFYSSFSKNEISQMFPIVGHFTPIVGPFWPNSWQIVGNSFFDETFWKFAIYPQLLAISSPFLPHSWPILAKLFFPIFTLFGSFLLFLAFSIVAHFYAIVGPFFHHSCRILPGRSQVPSMGIFHLP